MDLWNKAKEKIFKQPPNEKNAEEYYKNLKGQKERGPVENVLHNLRQRQENIKKQVEE